MFKFVPIKKMAIILAVFSFVYYCIAVALLASARLHELVVYQIVDPKEVVVSRALPIPFGKKVAQWLMSRSTDEEISSLFLYDIFLLPKELEREGKEQDYSVNHHMKIESFLVASFLIDLGANVNSKNNYGCTSLHLAIKDKNLEVVRFLLEHKANPVSFEAEAQREFCQVSPAELARDEGVSLI